MDGEDGGGHGWMDARTHTHTHASTRTHTRTHTDTHSRSLSHTHTGATRGAGSPLIRAENSPGSRRKCINLAAMTPGSSRSAPQTSLELAAQGFSSAA